MSTHNYIITHTVYVYTGIRVYMYRLHMLNVAWTPLKPAHQPHGIHFCQSCQAPGEEACGIRVAMEDCELHFMGPG